ncbi:Ribonuclease H protein, putative [Theobroma cacao]|uniref:Ribonuclease H protein, putative n=1 Tax=Theobroma cacao TaxID=3641 RepID=A0A061DMT3_THECC|nr:Ribonuclease H protein, putative [Theobroma cacao]
MEAVAAGGVFRNGRGGYSLRFGKCTAYRAELWGVSKGLTLAWDLGHGRINLEVDCMLTVQAITSPLSHPCSNSDLIKAIQNLLHRE